jgi:excisionase family DNA binding protein
MENSEATIPRYMRVPAAATYLKLSRNQLYRLVEAKRIPHIRKGLTGKAIIFDREALDRWMEESEVGRRV